VAELRRILFEYGEERFAPKIAAAIAAARERSPIKTTGELCEIIKSAMPAAAKNGGHHPAKRSFQAIRIEVNGELDAIEPAIRSAVSLLAPGGRIAIITFHSLEDRIVKQTFADLACGCVCPKDFPVCVCGKRPQVRLVSKKPILPSDEELERNPRSRSAKLRVAEKI
jgi:16S rRNA (cytosine1402-N4)-methyltransferase